MYVTPGRVADRRSCAGTTAGHFLRNAPSTTTGHFQGAGSRRAHDLLPSGPGGAANTVRPRATHTIQPAAWHRADHHVCTRPNSLASRHLPCRACTPETVSAPVRPSQVTQRLMRRNTPRAGAWRVAVSQTPNMLGIGISVWAPG
jgi:hypothetical protein